MLLNREIKHLSCTVLQIFDLVFSHIPKASKTGLQIYLSTPIQHNKKLSPIHTTIDESGREYQPPIFDQHHDTPHVSA